MNFFNYLKTAEALVITDLKIFRRVVIDKFINVVIWTSCVLIINAYLLPRFGIEKAFGIFSFAGMVAAVGILELSSSVTGMITDFELGFVIHYYATLPIPVWMMLARRIFSEAITHSFFAIAVLPVGKILLWNDFSISRVNWLLFPVIMLVGGLFYGAFSIFIASMVKKQERKSNVWFRFLFPIWFLGGFAFSWYVLKETSQIFSWIILINPMIYLTEAYRAVIIGPQGFIPFWFCISALIFFTAIFGYLGIIRVKKYLDFV